MSERHHSSPEKHAFSKIEHENKAAEHLKKLEKAAEKHKENHHELAEKAREQIKKVETPSEPSEASESGEPSIISGISRRVNYQHTMRSLQQNMKPASRAFSKFIHNTNVEKVSEAVGKTIMRPSVSLGATTTAVLVGGFVYLSARAYGFSLQGPELLVAFMAGGLIGLIAEALIKLIRQATR